MLTLILSLLLQVQVAHTPWVHPDDVGSHAPYAATMVQNGGFHLGNTAPAGVIAVPPYSSDLTLGAYDGAVLSTHYAGCGSDVLFRNVRMHGFGAENNKWGIRAYDAADYIFLDCTWDTFGSTVGGPDGHGCYISAVGPLEWRRCHFDDCAGQGIQVVYSYPGTKRKHETGLAPTTFQRLLRYTAATERHLVADSVFTNVGDFTKSERASYAISFFEPAGPHGPKGLGVRVVRCNLETSLPYIDANGVPRDCQGAVMVHAAQRFELLRTRIAFRNGTKDCVQSWGNSDGQPGTPDVVIAGCLIEASQPIDIRLGSANDTVVIGRNRGTATVRIYDAGAEWYAWPPKNGKLLYEGPVSKTFRLN